MHWRIVHWMHLVLPLGIAGCLMASVAAASVQPTSTLSKHQTVVLVSGRSLVGRRLPAFLQIEPGRYLSARAVQQACATPQLKSDSLLAFLPDLQLCIQMDNQDRLLLRQRMHELSGRWPTRNLLADLDTQAFVAIAPPRAPNALSLATCTCPVNHAPTGNVQCTAQTRTADAPIGTVTFNASDVDGDALSGTFSYQRDADPVQAGLPSSLTSACTSSPGTLQCTVNGTAPAPAGIVQLNLNVSDGNASLPLNSLLEVLAVVPDRIFADGFEYLGCQ